MKRALKEPGVLLLLPTFLGIRGFDLGRIHRTQKDCRLQLPQIPLHGNSVISGYRPADI
jgi:hypothetical protein